MSNNLFGCVVSPNGAGAIRNPGPGGLEDEDENDWFAASYVWYACIVKRSDSASLVLMVFMKSALSQSVIFGKGLVVSMFVAAAVRTSFRSKCF